MFRKFFITLCNPNNFDDEYVLEFNLINSAVVKKWQSKVSDALAKGYVIDDPKRFYGFNTLEEDTKIAIDEINKCINIINSYEIIINRDFTDINDTDTLNYLHHIFEKYHGLLDQQVGEFFLNSPSIVQKALADLNIAVHRVENVLRGNPKRLVTTYFGLPKIDTLEIEDFEYMVCKFNFGDLYLNYVEVGKTLEDLVRDNDEYIEDEAFKPWNYYSADFTVRFHNTDKKDAESISNLCKEYYFKNYNFFKNLNYPTYNNQLKPGKIKIGELIYTNQEEIIKNIKNHQYVKDVKFL